MNIMRRHIASKAFQLFDITLMVCSFLTAAIISLHQRNPNLGPLQLLSMRIKVSNILVFAAMLLIWHVIFEAFHLHRSKRLAGRRKEILDAVEATTLGTIVIATCLWLLHMRLLSPTFLLAFWVFITALTIASRLVLREVLAIIRARGRNTRNMLIVGTNRRALEFARNIQESPEMGYQIMGFADDAAFVSSEFQQTGYRFLCGLDSLPNFLRNNVVDEVILALPMRSFHTDASRIALLCEQQGIIVCSITNLFDLKARARTDEFEGEYVITHSSGMLSDGWGLIVKRVFDFALSFTLMNVLSPVLIATMIAIKLTSRGPLFFVQERLGLNKRKFRIYKFRTMQVGAEEMMKEIEHLNEVSGPVFKIRNDPRITKVGKFLRKTSIDELPQLFNVLKGDMSMVGPRPLAVRDYELMTQDCEDWQRCRFSVKPGITCLWQVNGRNALPFHRWMELDLEYIQNWSLQLDMRILFRTIPAVLKGSGA